MQVNDRETNGDLQILISTEETSARSNAGKSKERARLIYLGLQMDTYRPIVKRYKPI